MFISCCIKGCKTTSSSRKNATEYISLHKFPKNEIILSRWKTIIKKFNRQTKFPKKELRRICSLHFDDDSYYTGPNSRRLKIDVYPKKFPTLNANQSVNVDKFLLENDIESNESSIDSDDEKEEEDAEEEEPQKPIEDQKQKEDPFRISDDDEDDNEDDGDDSEEDVNAAKYGNDDLSDFGDDGDLLTKKKKVILKVHRNSMLRATEHINDLRLKNCNYQRQLKMFKKRLLRRARTIRSLKKMLFDEQKKSLVLQCELDFQKT